MVWRNNGSWKQYGTAGFHGTHAVLGTGSSVDGSY